MLQVRYDLNVTGQISFKVTCHKIEKITSIKTYFFERTAGGPKSSTFYPTINQRFIVWKLNNTNVDWKNTATVLNCVSARWQDEEDRPPISIFWESACFAGDSESCNPLCNLY
jgi:hypothetical protein